MIVFVARFPSMMNEKDGFTQRIAWIDALVHDVPRIYLDISLAGNIRKKKTEIGYATIIQLNIFLHFFTILRYFKNASIVYIHSVYNALRAIPAYWLSNTVTDMHGIVPEEMHVADKKWRARIFGYVERIAIKKSSIAVFVTNAMKAHFRDKYRRDNSEDKIIAILPKIDDERGSLESVLSSRRESGAVIYAGGIQPWQNISLMLGSAARASNYKFTFLSSDYQKLVQLAADAKVNQFSSFAVAPKEVATYYLQSEFGFILRDSISVNKVACPTKLVEYFHWGVIPIVLSPDIGDFSEMGFRYILLDDFVSGKIPNADELKMMRLRNREIIDRLNFSCNNELSALRERLRSSSK